MKETKSEEIEIPTEDEEFIFPNNHRKYCGSIHKDGKYSIRYRLRIKNVISYSKMFDSYIEAFDMLKELHRDKSNNLIIKNRIYEREDYYLVELNRGQYTKIDKTEESLKLIDSHIWHARKGLHCFYAATSIKKKLCFCIIFS